MTPNFIGRFDPGLQETEKDWSTRYASTWLWLSFPKSEEKVFSGGKVKDKPKDGYYKADGYDWTSGKFAFNSDEKHIVLDKSTEVELSVQWPENGWFHSSDGILRCFWRTPARQWKRAICGENCYLTGLSSKGNGLTATKLFEALMNPPVEGFEHAVELLSSGKYVGVAITKEFALALEDKDRFALLSRWGKVGFLYKKDLFFTIVPEVLQEIKDLLRNCKCNFHLKTI